ncbi:2-amino-4-hydroxy-6-hydroxymethyldihydropteridine diphosphokinase [Neisseriaceae bacterium ESL0693]|nr:2-amino-4-hydroxy-6-hydroxymethyldihydropteridine diphosphokinase [Neisseriaceae bacterium ESL0693]
MKKPHEVTAVIALGANLNQPAEQIQAALTLLDQTDAVTVLQASPLYCTRPVGYVDQPDFVNAVALIQTDLSAQALLRLLHEIEQHFGRQRTFRNAPRTLDLDIIDYAHQLINETDLQLPHPRAHERAFVMVPLAAIAPDYCIGQSSLTAAEMARQLTEADPDGIITRL